MCSIRKIACFVLLTACLLGVAFPHGRLQVAQDLTVRGIILKINSPERIAKAQVTDLKSNAVIISNGLGAFSIQASIGDTLLITKEDYTPQKVVIANSEDIIIYIQPVVKLSGVIIKGKTNTQELNEVITIYRDKGLYFDGKPPLLIFNPISGSPITGFHELLGKDAAHERRFIRFSKSETEAVEIDRRFTKELVKSITNLPDDELIKFMEAYRPAYADMKDWNDYQLIQYIKKSFADYQTNKGKLGPTSTVLH